MAKLDTKFSKNEKRSFFLILRTRQAFEKLALIPSFLYIRDDLSGVEKPLPLNLINDDFSDSVREKGANKGFQGLAGGFKTAAMTALATTLSFGGMAYAQDNPNAQLHNAAATTQIINPNYKKLVPITGGDVHRKRVVRMDAASVSNDQFAVVIYGAQKGSPQSQQAFQMTVQAAQEAQKDGSKVAFVIGTSDPAKFDAGEYKSAANPIHVEIYENGYLVNDGDYFLTPFIEHPDDGALMLNTNFATQMDDAFDIAKERYRHSMALEGKQASNIYTALDSFPN